MEVTELVNLGGMSASSCNILLNLVKLCIECLIVIPCVDPINPINCLRQSFSSNVPLHRVRVRTSRIVAAGLMVAIVMSVWVSVRTLPARTYRMGSGVCWWSPTCISTVPFCLDRANLRTFWRIL